MTADRNWWKFGALTLIGCMVVVGAVGAGFLLGADRSEEAVTAITTTTATISAEGSDEPLTRTTAPAPTPAMVPTTLPTTLPTTTAAIPTTRFPGPEYFEMWPDALILRWRESSLSLHAAVGYPGPIPPANEFDADNLDGARSLLRGTAAAICFQMNEQGLRLSQMQTDQAREWNGRLLTASENNELYRALVGARCPENL